MSDAAKGYSPPPVEALERTEPSSPAPSQAPLAPQDALGAILADPDRLRDFPIETVERLFKLSREMGGDVARREFAVAFNRVQGRLAPVRKRGHNAHTKNQYLRLNEVVEELDPIMIEEGFSRSMSTVDCPHPDHIRCRLTLRHIGGHVEEHYLDAPIDGVGPRGGSNMTRLQGTGSAMTYAERYLLVNVWGVQTADDDDGNRAGNVGPGSERITEDQAHDLRALIEGKWVADRRPEVVRRMLAVLKVGAVEDIPAGRFLEAINMLERKSRG